MITLNGTWTSNFKFDLCSLECLSDISINSYDLGGEKKTFGWLEGNPIEKWHFITFHLQIICSQQIKHQWIYSQVSIKFQVLYQSNERRRNKEEELKRNQCWFCDLLMCFGIFTVNKIEWSVWSSFLHDLLNIFSSMDQKLVSHFNYMCCFGVDRITAIRPLERWINLNKLAYHTFVYSDSANMFAQWENAMGV